MNRLHNHAKSVNRSAAVLSPRCNPQRFDSVFAVVSQSRNVVVGATVAVVILASLLIAWMDIVHSPVLDEVGHLPAGCLAIEFGRFDLYEVNPPLVKSVAAIPVVVSHPKYDWSRYRSLPGRRNEWDVGRDLIVANGKDSFRFFALARLALVPIWLAGTFIVWKWAVTLAGESGGLAATILWSFSPDIMGWTATICPDSSAASMGLLTVWWIRQWLVDGHWTTAGIVGIFVGLSIVTKTSWLLFMPLIPLLAIAFSNGSSAVRTIFQHLMIGLLALFVINAAYGFDGTCRSVRSFRFFSQSMAGRHADGTIRSRFLPNSAGNRFQETWLRDIPVPLPASFVVGLDLQKYDFEQGMWSYLGREHRFGGWWYWYIYALAVKMPTGTILLCLIAWVWFMRRLDWRRIRHSMEFEHLTPTMQTSSIHVLHPNISSDGNCEARIEGSETDSPWPRGLREDAILMAPAICLFVLVSSQTGFSRYLRYVLPCYPFVFIWISQIFSDKAGLPAWLRKVCWGFLAWSAISSLSVFPHSMSYFNELAGGPENGPAHLIDASIDWGQDVLFLADWAKQHPEAKPLYLSLHVFFDPRVAGINYQHPPVDPRYAQNRQYLTSDQLGPRPGWYAVSVHQLYSRNKEFAYLFDFPREGMVGYSIYIYHLTQRDVDDWNQKHRF